MGEDLRFCSYQNRIENRRWKIMAIDDRTDLKSDVHELFDIIKLNFKRFKASKKLQNAFCLCNDKKIDDAKKIFRSILRDNNHCSEKIIARMGIVVCSAEQENTEKVLTSLGLLSDMFHRNFFQDQHFFSNLLTREGVEDEKLNISINIFNKIIKIVEKIESESEKENKRVAGATRISARLTLAKFHISQKLWEEGLQNLFKVEKNADETKNYIALLRTYSLIEKIYIGNEGEDSENAIVYGKKRSKTRAIIAQSR